VSVLAHIAHTPTADQMTELSHLSASSKIRVKEGLQWQYYGKQTKGVCI